MYVHMRRGETAQKILTRKNATRRTLELNLLQTSVSHLAIFTRDPSICVLHDVQTYRLKAALCNNRNGQSMRYKSSGLKQKEKQV